MNGKKKINLGKWSKMAKLTNMVKKIKIADKGDHGQKKKRSKWSIWAKSINLVKNDKIGQKSQNGQFWRKRSKCSQINDLIKMVESQINDMIKNDQFCIKN